jgi:hypothetical protein
MAHDTGGDAACAAGHRRRRGGPEPDGRAAARRHPHTQPAALCSAHAHSAAAADADASGPAARGPTRERGRRTHAYLPRCGWVAGTAGAGISVCSPQRPGSGCSTASGRGRSSPRRRAKTPAACARSCAVLLTSHPLLVSWLLAIFLAAAPSTVRGATFAGIGKVVGGDGGTHRLMLVTGEEGADLLRVLNDAADPVEEVRGRDPSVGVASWNSVEKFYYYAAAEDGFASAYVTPFSYVTNQSISQRVLRGRTDTSFTLTSIQYNRIDAKIYGIITYSSGEHFMVKVLADTRQGTIKVELIFENLLQLDYTHIAPGLAALDSVKQRYYACGVKTVVDAVTKRQLQQGYLFAVTTGAAAVGIADPPAHMWSRELPGVLTSLQADPNTGNLYGMLHNVSGHFLLHFDPNNEGKYGGRYEYLTQSEIKNFKPDPSDLFTMTADAEVVFGLASFSPPSGQGRDAEADYFSVVYESGIDANGTQFDRYNVLAQNLGNAIGERTNPNVTSEEFAINNEAGYTMTSIQVMYTTIPMITQLVPSAAHIAGGMLVTVVGQPFVDTGSKMIRCRWRLFESGVDKYSGAILSSTHAYFVNSSVCVCITPELDSRVKGMLDLTLTNGAIWTSNAKKFTFFETTQRIPQVGSSKGGTLVQIKGLYLKDLPFSDLDFTNARGIPSVVIDAVKEAQCEFGTPPEDYAFDDKAVTTGDPLFQVQGNPPVGPLFRKAQCLNITVGLAVEEVCVMTCFSPAMPADQCIAGSTRTCSLYVRKCPNEWEPSVVPCRMMLAPYGEIPFAFTFFGQRVPMGTWAFNGDQSPVVTGAKFTDDGTCIVIQTDLDTNRGRSIGGEVSAARIFLNSELLFGNNAQVTYVLANRLMVCMAYNATCTSDSFYDFRPAALGARDNWFRFLQGTFVLDPVPHAKKPRPVAQIIAPGTSAQCTRVRVSGSASYYSGGRPLDYRWGMRASKCIDANCLNSVAMKEREHLWLLPAQRSLYYTKSVAFDAEATVTGIPVSGDQNTLDVASPNLFTWFLQTTNFFYLDYIEDTTKLIDGDAVNVPCVP